MRVRFAEQQVSNDLLEFLRRCECVAERVGDRVLEVIPKQPMLAHAARLEVEGLLRTWTRLHPDAGLPVFLNDASPRDATTRGSIGDVPSSTRSADPARGVAARRRSREW